MAVSEGGGPDSRGQERLDGQAGASLTHDPAGAGAGRRPGLRAWERRLLEEERRLLEQERRLLERERRLLDQGSHAFDWVRATKAGTFWSRLNAVDFMNSSLQFAALAVLCLFPFLITVSAESGGDARHALIARLGLDHQAAQDVNDLMSSGSHAVTTLSVIGGVFVVLGAMGVASTLQVWYQRVYDQPPAPTLWRQLANRLLWLGGLLGYLTVQDFSFIQLKPAGGARVPIYAAQIVSSHADYGSIGVVIVLLSYLIGLGVCIHLGAVAGRMWDERRSQPPADPEELPAAADRPTSTL